MTPLPHALRRWALYSPAKAALRDAQTGSGVTYAQADWWTDRMVERLRRRNIDAGDRVAVVAVAAGFCSMLVLLSFRFRRHGEATGALTMPHWIGNRYGSRGFAIYFALVNLAALAFVVLIVGGLSIVMQQLLGLSNTAALVLILGFVTLYVLLGGTYAHVFTNTLQGSLMLAITLVILASGAGLFFGDGSGLLARLAADDPNLVR